MISDRRSFILQNTRLRHVAFVPEVQLHLADKINPLWQLLEAEAGENGGPPPFWAFAWAGGQALARYLLDHPEEVAGQRVLDFASGSGLCAIAALKAGAIYALAADIDPFCEAALSLNEAANQVRVDFTERNLLPIALPPTDVILAGDICYEQALASPALAWLRNAHASGIRVLLGDPFRTYLPQNSLRQLAEYQVPTSHELEAREVTRAAVFSFG